jgi:hypothetical protein
MFDMFARTPPSTKRRADECCPHTVCLPLDTTVSSLPAATGTLSKRNAQSEQKMPSCDSFCEALDGPDEEKVEFPERVGTTAKLNRRGVFCFSTTFFLFAVLVGTFTNLVPLWSQYLEDYMWQASSMSFEQQAHRRTLFRTKMDDSTAHSTNRLYRSSTTHRPKLVIHMGPHKTASTTLQTDLTLYQDRLQLDNYLYLGRLYHPFSRDGEFFLNRATDSEIQIYFRNMFAKCWRGRYVAANKPLCVADLRDALFAAYGTSSGSKLPNLLISDEALLRHYDDGDTNQTMVNENYVMLAQILSRDWDIVLAVAYRRFFEWLPSAKYQKDKPTEEKRSTEWLNPTVYLDRKVRKFAEAKGGIPLQPLFPLPFDDNDDNLGMRTDEILGEWSREHFLSDRTFATIHQITSSTTSFSNTSSNPLQLHVYHLYGKLSIRTQFLCHVLPDAEHSCRASQRDDAMRQPETRINTRSNDGTTKVVIAPYPSAFFDVIAVAAAAPSVSLVNTSLWKRQKVASMLQNHYYGASMAWQEGMKASMANSWMSSEGMVVEGTDMMEDNDDAVDSENTATPLESKNPWELPLRCPSTSQLEQLLRFSLSLEARHLPKLYRKSADEHRAAFHAAVESSPEDYCWVDTDAMLLHDSIWKNHIQSVFSTPELSL